MGWPGIVLVLGGIGVGYIVLDRWTKAAREKAERAFRERVVDAAASYMGPKIPNLRKSVIVKGLNAAIEGAPLRKELADLQRVEVAVERSSPTKWKVTVIVLVVEDGEAKRGTVEMDYPYERLPSKIRKQYVTSGDRAQIFVILDTSKDSQGG